MNRNTCNQIRFLRAQSSLTLTVSRDLPSLWWTCSSISLPLLLKMFSLCPIYTKGNACIDTERMEWKALKECLWGYWELVQKSWHPWWQSHSLKSWCLIPKQSHTEGPRGVAFNARMTSELKTGSLFWNWVTEGACKLIHFCADPKLYQLLSPIIDHLASTSKQSSHKGKPL